MGLSAGVVVRRKICASATALAVALALCPRLISRTQTPLQITSPKSGVVVHPGETITLSVSLSHGFHPSAVGVIAEDPLTSGPETSSPPYRFTVSVPPTIAMARVYTATAYAMTGGPEPVSSPSIRLDVEPTAAISRVRPSGSAIVFGFAGEQIQLQVDGLFADGTVMDITYSTQIKYKSSDTKVATVTPNGLVTAVGTGCGPSGACAGVGMIYISFGGKMAMVQVSTSALRGKKPRQQGTGKS